MKNERGRRLGTPTAQYRGETLSRFDLGESVQGMHLRQVIDVHRSRRQGVSLTVALVGSGQFEPEFLRDGLVMPTDLVLRIDPRPNARAAERWADDRVRRSICTKSFDMIMFPAVDFSELGVFDALEPQAGTVLIREAGSPDIIRAMLDRIRNSYDLPVPTFLLLEPSLHCTPVFLNDTVASPETVLEAAANCYKNQGICNDTQCPGRLAQLAIDAFAKANKIDPSEVKRKRLVLDKDFASQFAKV